MEFSTNLFHWRKWEKKIHGLIVLKKSSSTRTMQCYFYFLWFVEIHDWWYSEVYQQESHKFVITGRTKHFINAFGEELIVDNAEKGLAKACAETGAQICEYSAAPVFMDENAKCRHQWLIEFAKMPDSVEKFASILDATLKEVNSDYEAKRWKDIALQPLEVI